MAGKKSIIMSGAAYSFLLYEIARNNVTQEGFLLGEINESKVEAITDNDKLSVSVNRTIKVHTVLACPQANYFYSGSGIIDKDKLTTFLGEKIAYIVGWYRFRNMKNVKLTLRDNLVHKQLMNFFAPPTELFIYSLISFDNSNSSTHIFKQSFFQYDNVEFNPINFNILNLSNATFSYKVPQEQSKIFNKIISSIKTESGSLTATDIHHAVQLYIEDLVKALADEEKTMFHLEQEVKRLQEQLKLKKSINCDLQIEETSVINGELTSSSNSSISTDNMDSKTTNSKMGTRQNDKVEKKSYSDMLRQNNRK